MALQQDVATRITYKAHSTGAITANTEAVLSSDPGASGGQVLRRVTSTLTLAKDTYQSNERRASRQISDFRHGVIRPAGELEGELSPGTYEDLMEAAFRGTKVATFSKTEAEFTSLAAANATSKLTVGASTWAAQDFRVGDGIRVTNASVAANNRDFLIVALSGVDATVLPAPTDMSADTTIAIARLGNKLAIPIASHVSRKFLFEHYHADIDIAELFAEARITRMALAMPATGLCTVRFGITARNGSIVTAGSAPFFTAPTAETSTGITAAVNGSLALQGTKIGILTGIELALDMATDAPAVVGQNFVPDIFLGRSVVTGQMTALLQDETMLNYFKNETEIEIAAMLTATSAASGPGLAFFMPRVKLGGASVGLQGEGGLPITMPFQALEKAAATGYDATTLTAAQWTS